MYNKELLDLQHRLLTLNSLLPLLLLPLFYLSGSDGLWDNVYNKELLDLLPKTAAGVDDAADKIARLARRHAADPAFASPYTAEARAQG